MQLVLKDAKLVKLTKFPGTEGTTQTLSLRGLLTRVLAEQLGCRDLCFAENGAPRRFNQLKLDQTIDNVEVVIDGGGSLMATSASHFTVGTPKEASETDASLEVSLSLHFDGKAQLNDWFDQRNKAQFEVSMTPPVTWNAQQSLFDQADPDNPPEEVEEEVEPESQWDENGRVEAAPPDDPEPVGEAASTAPPLASALSVVGGTHQSKGRRRKPIVTLNVGVETPNTPIN